MYHSSLTRLSRQANAASTSESDRCVSVPRSVKSWHSSTALRVPQRRFPVKVCRGPLTRY
jgi:hypothetical protein